MKKHLPTLLALSLILFNKPTLAMDYKWFGLFVPDHQPTRPLKGECQSCSKKEDAPTINCALCQALVHNTPPCRDDYFRCRLCRQDTDMNTRSSTVKGSFYANGKCYDKICYFCGRLKRRDDMSEKYNLRCHQCEIAYDTCKNESQSLEQGRHDDWLKANDFCKRLYSNLSEKTGRSPSVAFFNAFLNGSLGALFARNQRRRNVKAQTEPAQPPTTPTESDLRSRLVP